MGKGIVGEFFVNLFIKLFLDKKKYHLIKSVTLPTDDGTTQLDHIIVSRYGIFVLETKNYKGWIFGGEHQKQWTQQVYKVKNKFQNPLYQNYKHTRVLEEHLGLPDKSIKSVIAFVGDCSFKTDFPANVTKGTGCIDYIKSFKDEVYTEEQVQQFIEAIEDIRLSRTLKTHVNHVKHVKEIVAQKESTGERLAKVKIDVIPEKEQRFANTPEAVTSNEMVQALIDGIPEEEYPAVYIEEKKVSYHW